MNSQEQILEIFSQKNIEKVIYVDDILGKVSYHDNVFGKVAFLVNQGVWDQQYPFTMEADLWQEQFEDWWKNASFDEIDGFVKKYEVKRTNPSIADKLLDLLSVCNVELLSPEQFDDKYKEELIHQMKETQKVCMILIDYDLKGFVKNGDQLLESIANDDNILCGVFSRTFSIDEEIKKWEERNFNKNIYPISKKRFDGDDESLMVQGLKNVIWLKQIEKVKEMAGNAVNEACAVLENGMKSIDPATFNRMVIASSKVEGCWEFESLSRIIMVYLNKGLKQGIKKQFAAFQQNTNSIRALDGPNSSEIINDEILNLIRGGEWFDEIDYVNQVYSPISNGDIFQIGNKYYILLGQPCNLSIRPEGKRGYDLDQAFLLPLTTKDKAEEKLYLSEGTKGDFQYPFKNDYFHILFSDRKRVSLSLLDLVSYNANGLAEIDINVNCDHLDGREIMQENMLLRYNKILEKIAKYKNACDTIDNKIEKRQKAAILRFFCKSYEMGDEKVVKKPTISGTMIKFDVKRVGRYNSYGAHVLLQQFMSYMSRPEFPGDLGRC
ncbi:MAG: hypothetical protein J6A40_01005 [Bacteroides sp.]|nr:hypothetical protein [Bacteroides sp.]